MTNIIMNANNTAKTILQQQFASHSSCFDEVCRTQDWGLVKNENENKTGEEGRKEKVDEMNG